MLCVFGGGGEVMRYTACCKWEWRKRGEQLKVAGGQCVALVCALHPLRVCTFVYHEYTILEQLPKPWAVIIYMGYGQHVENPSPDLCNLHWWCFSFQQLVQILYLHMWWTSAIATCAGGVFPSNHRRKYSTCTRATCTVWWWLHVVVVYISGGGGYIYIHMVTNMKPY